MAFTFHFAPASGWMNDPNGLIERGGVHHLFFQHNPEGPFFGPMCWGHAVSTDLIRWSERPVALRPDTEYDVDGCWSGCAVPTGDERVAVIYSANRDGRQLPALALSADDDLDTWIKSPGNPVIDAWPDVPGITDLRDHALLAERAGWRQVLALGRDTAGRQDRHRDELAEGGRGGQLVSYRSVGGDLSRWTYDGVLLDGREFGLPGEVWECPDVFVLDGQPDGQAVVIMSWYTSAEPDQPSDVLWLTGALADGRFTPERYGRLDLGDRFYAPQSYATSDGRRLMFGWLRTQRDPASEGLPAVGAASLPRELEVVTGRLTQRPAAELEAVHRMPIAELSADRPGLTLAEPAAALELLLDAPGPAELAATAVELVGTDGERVRISLDVLAAPSTWERHHGGWRAEAPAGRTARILVDHGLIEIFTDGRAAAFSDLRLASTATLSLTVPAGAPDTRCVVRTLHVD